MKLQSVKGVFLHTEARWSKAYLRLTKTARDLLRLFMEKRVFPKKSGGHCVNNGKIILTHSWARKQLGMSKKAITDAFRLLIGVGFIEIEKVGEGRDGHQYRILIANNKEHDRDAKWKYYPDKSYFPNTVETEIGKDTRWKKGKKVKKNLQIK